MVEVDGRRAGVITTTRYTHSAWIGHLIVVPDLRMLRGEALAESDPNRVFAMANGAVG